MEKSIKSLDLSALLFSIGTLLPYADTIKIETNLV